MPAKKDVKRNVKLSREDQEQILRVLLLKYQTNPRAVKQLLPEVADILVSVEGKHMQTPVSRFFELTGKEQEERTEAYLSIVNLLNMLGRKLPREKAVEALESAAALQEASLQASMVLDDDVLLRFVRIATSLSLEKKGRPKSSIIREGDISRTVSLVLGIKANLSCDKRLLSIEVDPKGLAKAAKAFAFLGVGKDPNPDVALRHDEYAFGDPHE
ncbi:MAG: hypothetical protein HYU30_07655 [Chloroflexi bacterium]|nr:hypothetical protein [Chloroflexota bacterium]